MRDPNSAAWIATQAGCCPLVKDLPGMGKTSIIQQFARRTGRSLYTLIGSIREPADVGGFPYPVHRTVDEAASRSATNGHGGREEVLVKDPESGRKTRVEIQLVPPSWASDCHNGEDWIVFFDEITTCFTGETLVTMADGSQRPIKDVEPGEVVLSADVATGSKTQSLVLSKSKHTTKEVVDVKLSNGRQITCTSEHPFRVGGEWVPAGKLKPGDLLCRLSGLREGLQEGHKHAPEVSRFDNAGIQENVSGLSYGATGNGEDAHGEDSQNSTGEDVLRPNIHGGQDCAWPGFSRLSVVLEQGGEQGDSLEIDCLLSQEQLTRAAQSQLSEGPCKGKGEISKHSLYRRQSREQALEDSGRSSEGKQACDLTLERPKAQGASVEGEQGGGDSRRHTTEAEVCQTHEERGETHLYHRGSESSHQLYGGQPGAGGSAGGSIAILEEPRLCGGGHESCDSPGQLRDGFFGRERGLRDCGIQGAENLVCGAGGRGLDDSENQEIHVVSVSFRAAEVDVYDLSVEDTHCYFADEVLVHNCPPAVQAAMLRVIAERVVGDLAIPEDTWLISACNPSSIAANGFDLEAPMANRLVHLDWKFPWDSYREGLMNGLNFPEPEFPILPENWKDSIPEVASLVAAYCTTFQEKFHLPTDKDGNPRAERTELARAYPSPRSWEYLIKCLAACQSVGADPTTESELVHGCVGMGTGLEFLNWRQELDIPDPEDVLAWLERTREGGEAGNWPGTKSKGYVHPDRTDQLIAMLTSVVERVVGDTNDTKRYNESRWRSCIDLVVLAAEHQRDVATTVSSRLMKIREFNWAPGDDFVELFVGIGERIKQGATKEAVR